MPLATLRLPSSSLSSSLLVFSFLGNKVSNWVMCAAPLNDLEASEPSLIASIPTMQLLRLPSSCVCSYWIPLRLALSKRRLKSTLLDSWLMLNYRSQLINTKYSYSTWNFNKYQLCIWLCNNLINFIPCLITSLHPFIVMLIIHNSVQYRIEPLSFYLLSFYHLGWHIYNKE